LTIIGGMISGLAAKGPSGGGGSTAGMSGGGGYSGLTGTGYGAGEAYDMTLTTQVSGSDLLFIVQRAQKNNNRIGN